MLKQYAGYLSSKYVLLAHILSVPVDCGGGVARAESKERKGSPHGDKKINKHCRRKALPSQPRHEAHKSLCGHGYRQNAQESVILPALPWQRAVDLHPASCIGSGQWTCILPAALTNVRYGNTFQPIVLRLEWTCLLLSRLRRSGRI